MVTYEDITACLVTRGNVDMQPILDTLPYGEVIIWNNSERMVDLKVYGRYAAIQEATNNYIYFQDDDVIFTEHEALLDAYNQRTRNGLYKNWHVANNAHGPDLDGWDDFALSAAGAIIHKSAAPLPFSSYLLYYPVDEGFLYEADFIFGPLVSFEQVELPYTRLYADLPQEVHPHLCRQPWQEELKLKILNRARELR